MFEIVKKIHDVFGCGNAAIGSLFFRKEIIL